MKMSLKATVNVFAFRLLGATCGRIFGLVLSFFRLLVVVVVYFVVIIAVLANLVVVVTNAVVGGVFPIFSGIHFQ